MKIKFEVEIKAGEANGAPAVTITDRVVEVPLLSGYAYGSNAAYDRVADKLRSAYDDLCAEVWAEDGTTEWTDAHTLVLHGVTVDDSAVQAFADELRRSVCVCVNINN